MPRCSFRALNDLEGLNCKTRFATNHQIDIEASGARFGAPCRLVREIELPYSVMWSNLPLLFFDHFQPKSAESGNLAKTVTVGESVRINEQLCWVAGLAEGQGGV